MTAGEETTQGRTGGVGSAGALVAGEVLAYLPVEHPSHGNEFEMGVVENTAEFTVWK